MSFGPWPFISRHHTTEPSHSFLLSLTVSSAQQDLWFNLTEWCPGPPRLELRLWWFSGKSRAEGTGTWINAVRGRGGDHSASLTKNAIHIQCGRISISLGDRRLLAGTNMHKYCRCMCQIDWNWFWKQWDLTDRENWFITLFKGCLKVK